MPSNVNGFGTKYYGQRDFRSDGSYVTTNFFCRVLFQLFPCIPSASSLIPRTAQCRFRRTTTRYWKSAGPTRCRYSSSICGRRQRLVWASSTFGKSNLFSLTGSCS